MNHLNTARSATALVPWLVVLVVGGSSSRGVDAVPRSEAHAASAIVLCQATEPLVATPTGQRLAMFGPPPNGRPAIAAMPIDSQLLDEVPFLPGPHAFSRVEPLGDDVPGVNTESGTALPTIEDVWGQIILDETTAVSGGGYGESGRVHTPIPSIDRPSDNEWVESEGERGGPSQVPADSPERRPTDPLVSVPAMRRQAPWLQRDASLPGPHASEQHEETRTDPFVASNAPRVDESRDEYREPPTVPLPTMESVAPLVGDHAPRVAPAPQVATTQDIATDGGSSPAENHGTPDRAVHPLPDGMSNPRSAELEIVAHNADINTQRAFELAGKRAYFTARTEFIRSLRMLSEALDVHSGTQSHGQALAAGLLALEEADEFVPRGDHLEAGIDVPAIVSGHGTPVLKDTDASSISSLEARQKYYTFAQQQLAQSIGNEVAGSMALYGLGKLHTVLGEQRHASIPSSKSKAVVFHQAALLAVPQNALAANEMGVLMAQYGRLEASRELLLHSLRIAPLPTTWHNLSVVHARLGEHDLAQLAREEQAAAAQLAQSRRAEAARGDASLGSPVRWVAPEELARSSGRERLARAPSAARPVQSAPQAVAETPSGNEKDSSWWSRWSPKQRK